jgi:hypothetical protein
MQKIQILRCSSSGEYYRLPFHDEHRLLESNFYTTESNPPAKHEDLRRRILFLLKEKDRQGDYRHLFLIATDFDETSEDVRDQLDILKDLGLAEVTGFSH